MFNTIEKNVETIIVEKKSKFIANLFYVESEIEAKEKIEMIRKKYHDARHNTFAYRVLENGEIIKKQSDDGEPGGTAGTPMMNVLEKRKLVNVIVIVTRYFGGILLGTGGLARAYSEATLKAIEEATEIQKEEGYIAKTEIEYSKMQEFEYFCKQNKINIIEKKYDQNVKITLEISEENYKKITKKGFQNFVITIIERKNITKL